MVRIVLAASLCGCGAVASAAETFDWKKTLEQPLSPGTVAILVEHGREAEVQDRWRAGLKSEEAKVRTATARAIYGAGEQALAPALKDALDAEQDLGAAGEEIRALVAVGSLETDASIVAAVRRLPELRVFAWNHLGRARGTRALAHLAAARESDDGYEHRRSLVRAATNGGRNGLSEAATVALREKDAAAWHVVWESLLSGGQIGAGLLETSMTSDDAHIRAITYWGGAVVDQYGKVPDSFKKAMQAAPEAQADPKTFPADESARLAHFAYGLLARAIGGKREQDLEMAQRMAKREKAWPFPTPPTALVKLFSKDERKQLVALGHLPPNVEQDLDARYWEPQPFGVAHPSFVTPASVQDFPRGYVSGLVALTGCKDREILGTLTYGTEGRPRSVTLLETEGLSEDCARTGRILLASRPFSPFSATQDVRASARAPGPESVRLAAIDGATSAWDERRDPIRIDGRLRDPMKIKHVTPAYPIVARTARVQGVVILEAIIDISGRVQDLKVLRSIPMLDAAAVEAVRQWVFTPTLLDGVPVPVIYTVTVNFALD